MSLDMEKKTTKRKQSCDSCCGKANKTEKESSAPEVRPEQEETCQPSAVPEAKEEKALKSLQEWDDWKADYVIKGLGNQDAVIPTDKPKEQFRNYMNGARQKRVTKFYTLQHANQNYEFVQSMKEKYGQLNHFEMGVWEALEYLDKVVDDSDPDIDLTQLQHALQTAEACRKKFPDEKYDWMHLTGLIHDLGKILAVKDQALNLEGEPQWAVVGDTFPVGVPFHEKNVMFDSFKENSDYKNPKYNTDLGIYEKGCGLSNVDMCWGHDEYLYRVVSGNKCKLPLAALYIIRYHSFYPWHREGAYTELTNDQDKEMLKYVKEFNECDLYSKSEENPPNVIELAPYYKKLIEKYMPGKLRW